MFLVVTMTAPTEFMNSVNTPLKPAVPRSASQRLMTVTKPVPPIQRSPTPRLGTPEEDGVPGNALENGDRVGGQTEKTLAITEVGWQWRHQTPNDNPEICPEHKKYHFNQFVCFDRLGKGEDFFYVF